MTPETSEFWILTAEFFILAEKPLDFPCVNRYIITMISKMCMLLPVSVAAAAVVLPAGVLVIIAKERETGL